MSEGSSKISQYIPACRIDHEYWLPSETIKAVHVSSDLVRIVTEKESVLGTQVLSRIIRDFCNLSCASGQGGASTINPFV